MVLLCDKYRLHGRVRPRVGFHEAGERLTPWHTTFFAAAGFLGAGHNCNPVLSVSVGSRAPKVRAGTTRRLPGVVRFHFTHFSMEDRVC
jgi:hypothetical protein